MMTQDMQAYFIGDKGFNDFLQNLEKEGFSKLKTNESGDYLLIKQNLIE
ncbi:MAG: hypothetical protein R2822_20995 [Spirosomataceae bacterium]